MKIELPFLARFAWPVILAALALDLAVAGMALYTLSTAAGRVTTVNVDGLICTSYAPQLGDTTYLVARCVWPGE